MSHADGADFKDSMRMDVCASEAMTSLLSITRLFKDPLEFATSNCASHMSSNLTEQFKYDPSPPTPPPPDPAHSPTKMQLSWEVEIACLIMQFCMSFK